MLTQIIDVLKNSPADAWEVTETMTEGWEFYFIRHALDQNRVKNLEEYTVKVYRKSEDGTFLGSASGEIPPTADAAEIHRLVDQLLLAASLVKNPAYTLHSPADAAAEAAPGGAAFSLKGISEAFLAALKGVQETETEDLNSVEIFVSGIRKHFVNSEGVDVRSGYPSSMVEAVVNARKDGHEIELYRMYTSGSCDADRLRQDLGEVLAFGKARLEASPTPALGQADVVFSTDAALEIYSWYANRMNAAYKYMRYSDWEAGRPVAEADPEADRVTLTAVPALPNSSRNFAFDAEGAPIRETIQIRDNVAEAFLGSRQFSQYLGLSHSFQPSNWKVAGGCEGAEKLRQGDFLEPVEFSDFQVNPLTGDIAGEIRLAFWHHDGQISPVTGGSVSGNMKAFAKSIRFSRETRQYDSREIPAVTRLKAVTITGAE